MLMYVKRCLSWTSGQVRVLAFALRGWPSYAHRPAVVALVICVLPAYGLASNGNRVADIDGPLASIYTPYSPYTARNIRGKNYATASDGGANSPT